MPSVLFKICIPYDKGRPSCSRPVGGVGWDVTKIRCPPLNYRYRTRHGPPSDRHSRQHRRPTSDPSFRSRWRFRRCRLDRRRPMSRSCVAANRSFPPSELRMLPVRSLARPFRLQCRSQCCRYPAPSRKPFMLISSRPIAEHRSAEYRGMCCRDDNGAIPRGP